MTLVFRGELGKPEKTADFAKMTDEVQMSSWAQMTDEVEMTSWVIRVLEKRLKVLES
jgi:hypothetical protein